MHTSRLDRWAVAILTVLLLFVPLLHSTFIADPFELPKQIAVMAGALVLCLFAVLGAGRREAPAVLSRSIALVAGGLLIFAAVATWTSAYPPQALWGLARLAAMLTIAWGVARFAREPRHAGWLLRAALAAATLMAAGTLAQVAMPGCSLSLGGLSLLPAVPAGATLGDPGLAVQFLLLALPLALGAAMLSTSAGRLLCGAALGLIVAAIVYAGRPEGWYAGGLVVAAVMTTGVVRAFGAGEGWRDLTPDLTGGSVRAALVAGAVLLTVVAVSRVPGITQSGGPMTPLPNVGLLAPTTGEPATDRKAAIQGTTALLTLHPLGVGPGYWRHAFLEVAWTRVSPSPFTLNHQAVHVGNAMLELTSELGLVGGVLFAALLILLGVMTARTAFRDGGPRGDIALTALNVILAALVVGFFGSPFQETTPALLFWVAAGLGLGSVIPSTETETRELDQPSARPGLRPSLRWALVLVWTAVAIAAGLLLRQRVAAEHRTLQGQALLYAGDVTRAIAALSHPEAVRSTDHMTHVLLGNACLRAARYDDAVRAFSATLTCSPWFLSAYLGRAAANQELGFYDRADEDLGAALAIAPGSSDVLMMRGRLDTRRGRLEQAVADFRQAIDRNPNLADAWFAIGEIYARGGQYDAAIEAFRSCVAKNPRHPRVNLELGDAFEKKGIYEMAVEYYQRAASVDDKAVEPRLRLANMFHALGKECEAKDSLMGARDLETDPQRRAVILGLIDKVDPGCRKSLQQHQG